uniref:Uncharacterized protein n=1 Tax=Rhabditophanes sp. KR3021 TaxID=114890 RepID=A0AC35TXA4_9BILA
MIFLLNQVYSTKKPIRANFKTLALTATSFYFHKKALYLVIYEKLTWIDKVKTAISICFDEVIILLAIQASRADLWGAMITSGMDPMHEFGEQIC